MPCEFARWLLSPAQKDFLLIYFIPDFFSTCEIIKIWCSHHLNSTTRKRVLSSELLWHVHFSHLYKNTCLLQLKSYLFSNNMWNEERRMKIQNLLLNRYQFNSFNYSNIYRQEYAIQLLEAIAKTDLIILQSAMIAENSYNQTNFNTKQAKNLVVTRFFHILLNSQLDKGSNLSYTTSILSIFNNLCDKPYHRIVTPIWSRLIIDTIFSSNLPVTAYSFLMGGNNTLNWDVLPNTDERIFIPYLDFFQGYNRGYKDQYFQIHPYAHPDEFLTWNSNSCEVVQQLKCVIKYKYEETFTTFSEEMVKDVIYPQDLDIITEMFESFMMKTDVISYGLPVMKFGGNRFDYIFSLKFNLNHIQNTYYFNRLKCVNLHYSLRYYYQKKVDRDVHVLVKKITQLIGSSPRISQKQVEMICNKLAQYPSKKEIQHLASIGTTPLSFNHLYQHKFYMAANLLEQFTNLMNDLASEGNKGFKCEKSHLIKGIDKCVRRYIHLYIISQPHFITFTTATFHSKYNLIF